MEQKARLDFFKMVDGNVKRITDNNNNNNNNKIK